MTSNPYAPPESNSQFAGLPADTEFLISDTCILCSDEVALPKVCIYTGRTEDVICQQSTLKWTPRWLNNIQVILVFLMFPAMSLFQSGKLSNILRIRSEITVFVVAPLLILGPLILWYLNFRCSRRAMVTWYVSRQHDLKQQRRTRFWRRANLLGVGTLWVFFVAAGLLGWLLGIGLLIFVVTFWVFSLFKRTRERPDAETKLTIAGQHEGLNILTGFSPAFLLAVNEMIEEQR